MVRYICSDRVLDLFGRKIKLGDDQAHQYVTRLIRVRAGEVTIVNMDDEVVHEGDYRISRTQRWPERCRGGLELRGRNEVLPVKS